MSAVLPQVESADSRPMIEITQERAGEDPSIQSLAGTVNLVIHSPGRAGFGIVKALESVCALGGPEIAACLYRAPGILFENISSAQAQALLPKLESAGLEVGLIPADQSFAPGVGCLDLALDTSDPRVLTRLVREVMHLLGIDPRTARELVAANPAMLLGSVSKASAAAIQKRFQSLDARVQVINPQTSVFDVFILSRSSALTSRLVDNLRSSGWTVQSAHETASADAYVVSQLSYSDAMKIWESTGRRGDVIRIFNRALETFDVVLESYRNSEEIAPVLHALTGMPMAAVPKLLKRLPLVLMSGIDPDSMQKSMQQLLDAGAGIRAELMAFQTFSLQVTACSQLQASARVLQWLADIPLETGESLLRMPLATLEGPFGATKARWLQHELAQVGTTVRLSRRS